MQRFFKPAQPGRGGGQRAKPQPSPACTGTDAAAEPETAATAAGREGGAPATTQVAAAAARPTPTPAAQQQFVRKRRRTSDGSEGGQAPTDAPACSPSPAAAGTSPAGPAGPAAGPAPGLKSATRQLTQMHLDVGQADFHSSRCPTCGMLYVKGAEADERLHASFHANATQGPRYQGWPGETVAAVDGSRGRVLLFSHADQGRGRKALHKFCGFLEEQMGLPPGWLLRTPFTLLLYVSAARRIQGCVAAEGIKEAFVVQASLPPSLQHAMRSRGSVAVAGSGGASDGGQACAAAQQHMQQAAPAATGRSETLSCGSVAAPCTAECGGHGGTTGAQPGVDAQLGEQRHAHEEAVCSKPERAGPAGPSRAAAAAAIGSSVLVLDRRQRVRAVCGVRLMWVSVEARRHGLATRLLDACRCHFLPGYVLPRHQLAFSTPTDAGRALVEAYTGSHRFLVYE